jgi:hypothetical protein
VSETIDEAFKNILPGKENKWSIPWYASIDEHDVPTVMINEGTGEIWLRPDVWKDFTSNRLLNEKLEER